MFNRKPALLLFVAVVALSIGSPLAAARDDVLFVHGRSAAHNRDTAVYQSAYIEINWQALQGSQGQRIKINLFDDQLLIGIRDRLDPSSAANGFVWVGHLEGQPGSMVTLSAVDGLLIGSISWDGFERYTIRYDGSRQLLNAHDQTAVTEIEGPDTVSVPEPTQAIPEPVEGSSIVHRPSSTTCEDGSRIDLLVAYTSKASQSQGGQTAVEALINQRVSDMNSANINSGLAFRYNLAYTMMVDYDESGAVNVDLPRLRDRNDGYLDEVHAARNLYMADMVSLLVAEATTDFVCGVGYLMEQLSIENAGSAFNVAALDYAGETNSCSPWTMAHEFGHNMGNRHERSIDSGTPILPYAYGYQSPNETFRTIMAYNCPGGCPRINHWSSPAVMYAGEATGRDHAIDPQYSADNAQAMSQTALVAANYRENCTGDPPLPPYRAFLPLLSRR